jgi:hypothetical protein
MYKRLFSSPRCLQKRNDIITPPGGVKKRSEWVISRSLCYYQLFSLADIPAARRDEVLQLKIKQWNPFLEYGSYAVWQGEQAQVWIWDKKPQRHLFIEAGIKKATCLPETVLRSNPSTDTIQLIQCLEGVEGQIWKGGALVGSRWWAEMPTETEWIHFQRSHSLPIKGAMPTLPLEQDLLNRPWGRAKRHLSRFQQLYQERIWVVLGTIIITVLLTWQGVSIWKWRQATAQLQIQIDALSENIAPILAARTQAIAEKNQSERLLALAPYPSQLELLAQIAEKLPRKKTTLTEWFYQTGELRFTIETSKLDPTFYVRTFQKNPLFKEVKAKPGTGRKSSQMTISMQLNHP